MLFNSSTFVVFFAIVLLLHNLPIPWTIKKINLVAASYLFYAAWNPPFVALIWVSTLVNWFSASLLYRATERGKRKLFLTLCLVMNLSVLGFFKYGAFLLENLVFVLGALGINYHPPRPDILLPIGISFFTFHALSYTIDVYRGNMKPWGSLLDFALFVAFFPLLAAGPIIRAVSFLPQCGTPRRATAHEVSRGLFLLLIGLCGKVIVADGFMAPISDQVFNCAHPLIWHNAWAGTLAFSTQIFFDFAGYSTCAIGIAMCLGFSLPDNFRCPYGALGFSDFWRRWHISLSSWLKDYLYISLGGNRRGSFRTYVNLMTTMLLGGLWHGASWTFVAWGGLHGLFLVIERRLRAFGLVPDENSRLLARLGAVGTTYFCVCFTWVLFRAQSFRQAFSMAASMCGAGRYDAVGVLGRAQILTAVFAAAAIIVYHYAMRNTSLVVLLSKNKWWLNGILIAALLALLANSMTNGETRAFIYFQF